MYGESNTETYITVCKIDSQWEFAVWLRKLKQGLCMNLEGWDGEGDGREYQMGGDMCKPMAAEEPEIKLPTSTGSLKKQESSRKTSTSALLTTPKPLWIRTNREKFFKRWEYQTT